MRHTFKRRKTDPLRTGIFSQRAKSDLVPFEKYKYLTTLTKAGWGKQSLEKTIPL
ncbi:hypothetical protein OHAE_2234 [Ochrobactrum soli]|uniref:Uncharacterized protein n=1 Tax=Ochrobactrum soli TaxID=2448455 RepID=A0A2P9HQG9_9HYPH|nr:hypothetical protein OHAE_2234 [[Ochrobactrum] soli]